MKYLKYILLFFLLYSTVSCSVSKNRFTRVKPSILNESLGALNGTFKEISLDETENNHYSNYLYRALFCAKRRRCKYAEITSSQLKVQLDVLNPTEIQAKFLNDDKIIDSVLLKGSFKNGYFYMKTEVDIYDFAVLTYKVDVSRTILGITKLGNLILVNRGNSGGGFLILPLGGVTTGHQYEFERLTNKKDAI